MMTRTEKQNACELAAVLATQWLATESGSAGWRAEHVGHDTVRLLSLARSLQRRAEHRCNYGTDDAGEARYQRADDRDMAKVRSIAAFYGATVEDQGDVRGATFRLIWPGDHPPSNGFISDGWGVCG
jgi:hypothetical protein